MTTEQSPDPVPAPGATDTQPVVVSGNEVAADEPALLPAGDAPEPAEHRFGLRRTGRNVGG
jgi:hypothetical protein